jgi:hypothetical protein
MVYGDGVWGWCMGMVYGMPRGTLSRGAFPAADGAGSEARPDHADAVGGQAQDEEVVVLVVADCEFRAAQGCDDVGHRVAVAHDDDRTVAVFPYAGGDVSGVCCT